MALTHIPCAPNSNAGEQVTRNFLMQELADSNGVLLTNYHLPSGNSTLEMDLVLFNERGVWILEVKNWRGYIDIDQTDWRRDDGFIQHSPLTSVEMKAKALYSVLENIGHSKTSVVGFVVLSQANTSLRNTNDMQSRDPREDRVFHLDARLIRALTGEHFLHHKAGIKALNMARINSIVKRLLPLKVDPGRQIIGTSYRIKYDLGPSESEGFHAYQAEHVTIPGRYALAKKYHELAISTDDLYESIERFQRDMRALSQMEHHPNILQVYDYQPDRDSDDTYWLLLEWTKGITLRERLNGPPILWPEQLRVLNSVLAALDCCHSNDILHRNLNPACLYLANDGTVKLGDFDFARVPNFSRTLTMTDQPVPWKTNRYMAPELQVNARAADARSDLYALGAIWYDMAVRPEPDEGLDLSRLEKTVLSDDARHLLSRLLADDPAERPQNAKAAKRWLEQV
nr:NERD domain-containing protein [Ktedonobacteraceae bacterium]